MQNHIDHLQRQAFEDASFAFQLQTQMRFGVGVCQTLPRTLVEWRCAKLGVILDNGLKANLHAQELLKNLNSSLPQVEIHVSEAVEPDYDYLDEFRSRFDSSYEMLVVLGGGSTVNLAKAVSVLITNPGPAIQYRGFDLVKNPGVPLVILPTTAGTGSEVTPNAVFTDKREMRKFGINTSLYLPKLVLLDPQLTVSCPAAVTLSAGMDALVHTLESFAAKRASPISRIFSRAAFPLLFNSLAKVLEEPQNLESRARMQLGAYYAGIALFNSGAGPSGALSYPLGVHFRVSHGIAGAVFLPKVVRWNTERGYAGYGELYSLIEGAAACAEAGRCSAHFCEHLDRLCERIAVPDSLTVWGVTKSDIPLLSQQTMLLRGALEQNPVNFGQEEVRLLLDSLT